MTVTNSARDAAEAIDLDDAPHVTELAVEDAFGAYPRLTYSVSRIATFAEIYTLHRHMLVSDLPAQTPTPATQQTLFDS